MGIPNMTTRTRITAEKMTARVRLFLSLNPPRFIEGTVTIPSPKTRLSDALNDDRPFLSVHDVVMPVGEVYSFPKFLLLNKKEIQAVIEIE